MPRNIKAEELSQEPRSRSRNPRFRKPLQQMRSTAPKGRKEKVIDSDYEDQEPSQRIKSGKVQQLEGLTIKVLKRILRSDTGEVTRKELMSSMGVNRRTLHNILAVSVSFKLLKESQEGFKFLGVSRIQQLAQYITNTPILRLDGQQVTKLQEGSMFSKLSLMILRVLVGSPDPLTVDEIEIRVEEEARSLIPWDSGKTLTRQLLSKKTLERRVYDVLSIMRGFKLIRTLLKGRTGKHQWAGTEDLEAVITQDKANRTGRAHKEPLSHPSPPSSEHFHSSTNPNPTFNFPPSFIPVWFPQLPLFPFYLPFALSPVQYP